MDTSGTRSAWDYIFLHGTQNVNHQLGRSFWYIRESVMTAVFVSDRIMYIIKRVTGVI
jgi:hypothetical protein